MSSILGDDLRAASGRDATVLQFLRTWLVDVGFRAVVAYRMANWCHRRKVRLVPALIAARSIRTTGAEIRPTAQIGPGLTIRHPVGVVIGGGARLGARCTILQNSTLGEKLSPDRQHCYPTLGDDVIVGAGAAVLGGVRVGNGAVIGANAVVLDDVEDYAVVAGVPARRVSSRPLPGDASAPERTGERGL